jgi:hypothetical protein
MAKNSIYLTGWEYNRLLVDDPTKPLPSALPGAVLWDGGFQFWMFENAFCTRESLECEIRATDVMGFGQGQIFRDLQRRGFLKPFDWADLKRDEVTAKDLLQQHNLLRSTYDRETLIQLLETGQGEALQGVKLRLIQPILKKLNCVGDVTANSIAHWMRAKQQPLGDSAVTQALKTIAQPLVDNEWGMPGITVCERPGSRATMEQKMDQRRVEEEVEKPLIPSLMAGELPYDSYFEAQLPHREVYQPINLQLVEDWHKNADRLERLRDWAKKDLWPNLHGDWLPRLDENPAFLPELKKLVRDAVFRAKHEWFDTVVRAAIATTSIYVGSQVGLATGNVVLGTAAGINVKDALGDAHKKRVSQTENLTLFYQSAKAAGPKV